EIEDTNAEHVKLIRVSHEEASAFIADHLKNEVAMRRKKVLRSFETACYLVQYHDTPQLKRTGSGSNIEVQIGKREKNRLFSPFLHADPIDLLCAFALTDDTIKKFADECATKFECKKGGLSSGELLQQTEALVNQLFTLETQKKELQTRFESLMAISEPKPVKSTKPYVDGEFLIIPERDGQRPVTIT
ncbi:MAG: hypothetical protein K9J77_06005, partial [Rhodoferax sp.]|nr:hypothetical protein [Rhodoferax sp.]